MGELWVYTLYYVNSYLSMHVHVTINWGQNKVNILKQRNRFCFVSVLFPLYHNAISN